VVVVTATDATDQPTDAAVTVQSFAIDLSVTGVDGPIISHTTHKVQIQGIESPADSSVVSF
jgi:hypothetical protein